MANAQRRRIGAIRKTGAVVLASIGLFTAMAGLGMQSWPLGAVGVAMVILAVALIATSSLRGADRAFVVGKAYVLEVTEAPASLTHGRCEMHLQVEAPGHPPASVRVRDPRVPVAKWPTVGDVLPVRVAVDDLRRVKVLWDETLTHTQRQQQEYTDADYDGVTDENEPLYDDQRQRVYTPDFSEAERDDLTGYRDDDPIEEGPPLPQRKRKPSPHPRSEPAEPPMAAPSEAPITATQVLEGQIVQPMDLRVDIIDFSDAPPSPTADVPPYTAPRQGTPQDAPGEALRDEPPGEWPPPRTQTAEPQQEATPEAAGAAAAPGETEGAAAQGGGAIITIFVADIGRSVALYRDLLGMVELSSGPGNAILSSGETRIELRGADDSTGGREPGRLDLPVPDIDSVYGRLQEHGIPITRSPHMVNRIARLELWAVTFHDPDGHEISLTEWRSRS